MATKKKQVMNPYGIPGMTTQEFKDAAKERGYNPLIASHLQRFANELDDGSRSIDYSSGKETTDPKKPSEEKPKEPTVKDPFNPDKPDVVKNPYVPTPKTSSASEGSGLDYLRDAKGMRAREKDARLSGHTQRLLSERRLKSNLNEMMGEKVMGEDPKTGDPRVERTGGLTRFRREEAERVGGEKKKWNEARGPGGELLGRLIRDKAGRTVGHSTTGAGRAALGESYTKGSSGVLDYDRESDPDASDEEKDNEAFDLQDKKNKDRRRMGSRGNKFRDLLRRTQEGRLTD